LKTDEMNGDDEGFELSDDGFFSFLKTDEMNGDDEGFELSDDGFFSSMNDGVDAG
jgi:hypothetical protein